jgi:hypothetical protein
MSPAGAPTAERKRPAAPAASLPFPESDSLHTARPAASHGPRRWARAAGLGKKSQQQPQENPSSSPPFAEKKNAKTGGLVSAPSPVECWSESGTSQRGRGPTFRGSWLLAPYPRFGCIGKPKRKPNPQRASSCGSNSSWPGQPPLCRFLLVEETETRPRFARPFSIPSAGHH